MEYYKPLLTIAIPTFNGARTIASVLDILLPQVIKEVEVIIVDNCSTDSTPEIIYHYIQKYPWIKYHRNETNIGADGNFLKCMNLAQGKYIHLLSDDDILTENSLNRILDFLKTSPEMGLIYLGTANFYSHYIGKEFCTSPIEIPRENFYTKDKTLFFKYASHYWGFISSFIISNDRFVEIKNPSKYFGTYWLQSYIHILCASGQETMVGVIKGICIAAGVYVTQSNFDTSLVDGIYYRKMLDFAIDNGFNKKQLNSQYIHRLCLLASHGIIKEKATGNININKKRLFNSTKGYLQAWVKIYPMYFVPTFVCKIYMKIYRRHKGVDYSSNLNRAGDVSTTKHKDDK